MPSDRRALTSCAVHESVTGDVECSDPQEVVSDVGRLRFLDQGREEV